MSNLHLKQWYWRHWNKEPGISAREELTPSPNTAGRSCSTSVCQHYPVLKFAHSVYLFREANALQCMRNRIYREMLTFALLFLKCVNGMRVAIFGHIHPSRPSLKPMLHSLTFPVLAVRWKLLHDQPRSSCRSLFAHFKADNKPQKEI